MASRNAIISPMPETQHTSARVVLASASPRRRRLLSWLELPFDITSVETPEDLDSPLASHPQALACSLAEEKAQAVRDEGAFDDAVVLTFDTIVVLDGKLLGKPRDTPDAWRMLRTLSSRTHQVVTGCGITCPGQPPRSFAVTTNVRMKPLSDCQIEAWMALGEFMGCAGAYNIEGQVAEVTDSECYQNVAGLPLCHLYAAVRGALPGIQAIDCWLAGAPSSPIGACDAALCRKCLLGPTLLG